MGLSFVEGPSGQPVPVGRLEHVNTHDPDFMRGRVRELEALCADVLMAAVELGLPQPLLNRLWAAVGHGELPHAFQVDLPPKSDAPQTTGDMAHTRQPAAADPVTVEVGTTPYQTGTVHESVVRAQARDPMQIPDIRLSTNPLLSPSGAAPKPAEAELKPLAVRKTVAVVDDDPMMLDVLERILQRENFELLMAGGGPAIMSKLESHAGEVDLLVTDFAMPEMQGRELAAHVRRRYPAIKVLYQTGFSDMLFENCVELEEGAAFLEKPFTARGLREAVRLVLFGTLNPA
jgi:CheY-like chemotaxis protein